MYIKIHCTRLLYKDGIFNHVYRNWHHNLYFLLFESMYQVLDIFVNVFKSLSGFFKQRVIFCVIWYAYIYDNYGRSSKMGSI